MKYLVIYFWKFLLFPIILIIFSIVFYLVKFLIAIFYIFWTLKWPNWKYYRRINFTGEYLGCEKNQEGKYVTYIEHLKTSYKSTWHWAYAKEDFEEKIGSEIEIKYRFLNEFGI